METLKREFYPLKNLPGSPFTALTAKTTHGGIWVLEFMGAEVLICIQGTSLVAFGLGGILFDNVSRSLHFLISP